ncbi:glycosyl transferase [Leptolyngbya sp. Heron Island J]|uniref:glycosyl transferase n=1 Tax=Leptolyngbya sp. Heron Island J TaxID=1385935 RepID=UPI0003B99AEE|nr:glycosyl transferase [Leptolyngbya sp. Heron Island J]ESA38368.1 glycosyl transferase [Leptolyngbya sp. Heron Island J]
MPRLYVAITNHGFGHSTRAASVLLTLQQIRPDVEIILATTAPQWLLQSYLQPERVTYRPVSFDIGVLQSDSLTMDKAATLEKLKWIRDHQDEILAPEIEFIKNTGVGLILGDIPPLLTQLAKAVDLPCWMMGNFGWDFIYRPWGGEFEAIADWIAACFRECDRMFRLPFHEAMTAFPNILDVGLTGGTPKLTAEAIRERFGITTPSDLTVLLTFGGLGLAKIPYEKALRAYPDWQFLTFDRQAPELPNLIKIVDLSLRPADMMVLCDRVVSKPGYSTFAEACRLERGVVTLPREGFAEAQLLLDGIQRHAHHQLLNSEAFFGGDWSFLEQPLVPPKGEKLATDGNAAIANAISDYLS